MGDKFDHSNLVYPGNHIRSWQRQMSMIKISLKFIPKCPINNIPALVQIMAWCRSGDKPLPEPMVVSLLTHICVTRPQWVNYSLIPKFKGFWAKPQLWHGWVITSHHYHDVIMGAVASQNHQPHDCLFSRLFWRRSKITSKLRVTGLCAGNSPVTGEFTAQMASNAENVSVWWRHHDVKFSCYQLSMPESQFIGLSRSGPEFIIKKQRQKHSMSLCTFWRYSLFIDWADCPVSAPWSRVWVAYQQISPAVGCQCRRQYGPSSWSNPGSPACWPGWSSCWAGRPARGQDLRATSVRWRRHWGGSRCTCGSRNYSM